MLAPNIQAMVDAPTNIDGIYTDSDDDAMYTIPSNKRKPVDSNIKNHE